MQYNSKIGNAGGFCFLFQRNFEEYNKASHLSNGNCQ